MILNLFSLYFLGCTNENKLEGTWRLVLEQEKQFGYSLGKPFNPLPENYFWDFDKNTLAKIVYPVFLLDSIYSYSFNDDSIFLESFFMKEIYRYQFNDDTLKLTLNDDGGGGVHYYYFLPETSDEKAIQNIRKNGVNWSKFSGIWQFADYFPRHPKEGFAYDKIITPDIIDLTESNSSSYQFDEDKLRYKINDTVVSFRFSDFVLIGDSILLLQPIYDTSLLLPIQYSQLTLGYYRK